MSGKYDLRHFRNVGNTQHTQTIMKPLLNLAEAIVRDLPAGAERNAGLRKLLEASDCFKRAIAEARPAGEIPDVTEMSGEIDPITGKPLPVGSPYAGVLDSRGLPNLPQVSDRPFLGRKAVSWNYDVISDSKIVLFDDGTGESHARDCRIGANDPCNCEISMSYDKHNEYDPECRCSRCRHSDRTGG